VEHRGIGEPVGVEIAWGCSVKLGKVIGRITFVVGFVGPVLFYASPPSFPTYESHIVCPLCPYIDVAFGHALLWLQIGLELGLFQGIAFALLGFTLGYAISRFR
jgi:hypothetical protein